MQPVDVELAELLFQRGATFPSAYTSRNLGAQCGLIVPERSYEITVVRDLEKRGAKKVRRWSRFLLVTVSCQQIRGAAEQLWVPPPRHCLHIRTPPTFPQSLSCPCSCLTEKQLAD